MNTYEQTRERPFTKTKDKLPKNLRDPRAAHSPKELFEILIASEGEQQSIISNGIEVTTQLKAIEAAKKQLDAGTHKRIRSLQSRILHFIRYMSYVSDTATKLSTKFAPTAKASEELSAIKAVADDVVVINTNAHTSLARGLR